MSKTYEKVQEAYKALKADYAKTGAALKAFEAYFGTAQTFVAPTNGGGRIKLHWTQTPEGRRKNALRVKQYWKKRAEQLTETYRQPAAV